jgi:hypothetical protein
MNSLGWYIAVILYALGCYNAKAEWNFYKPFFRIENWPLLNLLIIPLWPITSILYIVSDAWDENRRDENIRDMEAEQPGENAVEDED